MLKNWCVYILALIGSVVFFLFYQMWLAWYCLVVLLLILPIALLIALLSWGGCRIYLESPKGAKIGDKADITLRRKARKIAALALTRVDMSVTERMTGITEGIIIPTEASLRFPAAGIITTEQSGTRIS